MGQGKWAIVAALSLGTAPHHALAADPPASASSDGQQTAAAVEAKKQTALRVMQTGAAIGHSQAADRIESQLRLPLRTELKFVETPLSTVMQVIADEYDLPIQFDKPALDAVAASPDAEVTFALRKVTLSSALDIIFRGVPDLAYVIDDEVLLITSQDEAAKRLEVRVYRVDDLLQPDPRADLGPAAAPYNRLVELVTAAVEYDSWKMHSTGEGVIQPFAPGMLVISQTRRVHTQIDQLFRTLRTIKEFVLADAAASAEGDQLITQGIPIADESLAKDQSARNVIRDVLMRSADWKLNDDDLAAQVSLDVLPTRVVIRHKPAVVRQVQKTLRDLELSPQSIVSEGPPSPQSPPTQRPPTQGRRGGF